MARKFVEVFFLLSVTLIFFACGTPVGTEVSDDDASKLASADDDDNDDGEEPADDDDAEECKCPDGFSCNEKGICVLDEEPPAGDNDNNDGKVGHCGKCESAEECDEGYYCLQIPSGEYAVCAVNLNDLNGCLAVASDDDDNDAELPNDDDNTGNVEHCGECFSDADCEQGEGFKCIADGAGGPSICALDRQDALECIFSGNDDDDATDDDDIADDDDDSDAFYCALCRRNSDCGGYYDCIRPPNQQQGVCAEDFNDARNCESATDDDDDTTAECPQGEECCQIREGAICLAPGCRETGESAEECGANNSCPGGKTPIQARDQSGNIVCVCLIECGGTTPTDDDDDTPPQPGELCSPCTSDADCDSGLICEDVPFIGGRICGTGDLMSDGMACFGGGGGGGGMP